MHNPNYDNYLTTATQLQRWRDFLSQVVAFSVANVVFIGVWWVQGKGFFWPIYPLLGWGVGISFQHFGQVLRGQITEYDVRRKLREFKASD